MSGRLAATIALYAIFCAVVVGLGAALGRERGPLEIASLAALEVSLVVQAIAVLIAIAGGERPSEPATFGGYLAASIAVLPITAGRLRDPRSRWDGIGLAAACIALAVVTWRLDVTWTG